MYGSGAVGAQGPQKIVNVALVRPIHGNILGNELGERSDESFWGFIHYISSHSPIGCAATGSMPMEAPKLAQENACPAKIDVISKSPVGDILAVTLIRIDTELDYSSKAQGRMGWKVKSWERALALFTLECLNLKHSRHPSSSKGRLCFWFQHFYRRLFMIFLHLV